MAQSIKLSDELMSEVRREAKLQGRSLAAQVTHWARIGRAIERSASFTPDQIDAVLAKDTQTASDRDAERVVWVNRMIELWSKPGPGEEAFFAERRRLGLGVGLDENGNLVHAADLIKAPQKGQ